MTRAKYPIYTKPSTGFMRRLKRVLAADDIVTGLEFVQWTKARFSAQWRYGKVGKTFTAEMSLGGAEPSLDAIEKRLLGFLKEDKTLD